MNPAHPRLLRRALLQATAGLAAGGGAGLSADAQAAPGAVASPDPRPAPPPRPAPAATGRPGDFQFLSGEWKIRNRRLREGQWDEFDGGATVHGILGGVASVEELRIPARGFSGMGLRLLDVDRKLWADFWVNAKSGVLGPQPTWGSFVDGVGTWDAVDTEAGQAEIWRGVWDRITPSTCRWFQAVSRDGGKTFQDTWVMHWSRA